MCVFVETQMREQRLKGLSSRPPQDPVSGNTSHDGRKRKGQASHPPTSDRKGKGPRHASQKADPNSKTSQLKMRFQRGACLLCGQMGHFKSNCPQLHRRGGGRGGGGGASGAGTSAQGGRQENV